MEIHPLTVIAYSFSSIPIVIGLTYTNKVEGIVKAIVGLFITFLPFILFIIDSYIYKGVFFKWLVIILEGDSNKNSGLQGLKTIIYSSIYTLVAYISVIIMMLKTNN
jgi:hypothetical protein